MKKNTPRRLGSTIEPYIWILPSVILMAIFIIVPIGFVFRMAFSQVTKAGLIKGFAGFDNFSKVLGSSKFTMVLKNTVVWTVLVVVLSTVLGFILALILNNQFKGRKVARAIVVFPWATTLVIQASAWKFIINTDYGALNTLLKTLGIIQTNVNWTPTPGAFFAWEIACGIFVTIPFVCFTALSGLQSIDSSLYEAAIVDGASYWQAVPHHPAPGKAQPDRGHGAEHHLRVQFLPHRLDHHQGRPRQPYRYPGYLPLQAGLLQWQAGRGRRGFRHRLPDSAGLRQLLHGLHAEERRGLSYEGRCSC